MSTEKHKLIPSPRLSPEEQAKAEQAVREQVRGHGHITMTGIYDQFSDEIKRKAYLPELTENLEEKQRALDAQAATLQAEKEQQLALVREWEGLLRGRDAIKSELGALDESEKRGSELIESCQTSVEEWIAESEPTNWANAIEAAGTIIKTRLVIEIGKSATKRKEAQLKKAIFDVAAFASKHGIAEI